MLKPFATKLDESIIAKLDDIARKTQIPKSRLCRQAIEMLAEHYKRLEENLAKVELMNQHDAVTPAESTSVR